MALRMNARFVSVVVPLGPGVTVLNADESRVILIGFRVMVSNFLEGDVRY
jgi:hypothetical protein